MSKLIYIFPIILFLLSACKKDDTETNPEVDYMIYTNGSGEIGKAGGEISINNNASAINGTSLKIPESALNKTTNISIASFEADLNYNDQTGLVGINFKPDGLTFSHSIEVTVPIEDNLSEKPFVFFYNDEKGEFTTKRILSYQNKIVSFETDHFSKYIIDYSKNINAETFLFYTGSIIKANIKFTGKDNTVSSIPLNRNATLMNLIQGNNIYTVGALINSNFTLSIPNDIGMVFTADLKDKKWVGAKTLASHKYILSLSTESDKRLRIYKDNIQDSQLIYTIENSTEEQREAFFSGEALCFNFDIDIETDAKYYIETSWRVSSNTAENFIIDHHWAGKYILNTYDEDGSVTSINEMSTLNTDKNNNGINDDFEYKNAPPQEPYNPTPVNGATEIATSVTLQWECSDPEGDQLDYDIILDTNPNPTRTAKQYHNSKSYTVNGLESGTTYYWKIWAYDREDNQTEGPVWSFTTEEEKSKPTVETNDATDITESSATLNGEVTSDGGATITERGFYWSKSNQTPNSGDNVEVITSTTVSFSKTISNLQENTSYYYRAFAINSQGITTGDVVTFTTNHNSSGSTTNETGTFTDSRDGHNYKWVKIGDQVWMAENLAYLPNVSPSSEESYTEPYYYIYDYNGTNVNDAKSTDNYKTYGVWYNWPAAKICCPEGWQLPSLDQWIELINFCGGKYYAGGKLKSQDYWGTNNGTDEYLFNVLPAGIVAQGSSIQKSEFAYFWTNKEEGVKVGETYVSARIITFHNVGNNILTDFSGAKLSGYSIRCIKSNSSSISLPSVTSNETSDITSNTATLNANILTDGGAIITKRGFYWSNTNNTPSANDNIEEADGTTGTFSITLNDLEPNTTYYYRAFATNSEGTALGSVISFTTQEDINPEITYGTLTDSRDGKTYKTVKIGEQWWMAENLAYDMGEGCSVYDNDENNAAIYGRLYIWESATNSCPDGWHLSTNEDWEQLAQYVSETKGPYSTNGSTWTNVGQHLKSKGTIQDGSGLWRVGNYSEGLNDFGFSALPGGFSTSSGSFERLGTLGIWWTDSSSNEYLSSYFCYQNIYHNNVDLVRHCSNNKENHLSVRCIKD